jgi:hypothetical protein
VRYTPKTNLDILDPLTLKAIEMSSRTPRIIKIYCLARMSYLKSKMSKLSREHPNVPEEKKAFCKRVRREIPTELDW